MTRINFAEEPELNEKENENSVLKDLIPQYAMNKQELDDYTAICKRENEEIKAEMAKIGKDEYETGGYVAKRGIQHKESINEARLIEILRKHHITDAIKTKEYVDMDALEDYLYNHEATNELATDLASCKSTTEVVTLRVTKAKAKKEKE